MISIIVPVYNIERYLGKCIDSLLAQTYQDIEIILVDDGSTDNSPAICDYYAELYDQQVRVIHTLNKGVSAARNIGIKSANGEYIGFVDGDDWIESEMYEQLYYNIKQTGSELSVCGIKSHSEKDHIELFKCDDSKILSKRELMHAIITDYSVLGYSCNKLFRRDVLLDTLFDTDLQCSEDMEFCIRYVSKISKGVSTPSQMYHYRMRGDSTTGKFSEKKLSVYKAFEKVLPTFHETSPQDVYIIEKYLLKQYLNVVGSMRLAGVKNLSLEQDLKSKSDSLFSKVLADRRNTMSEKANIIATRMMPAFLLRIKQMLLKRRHHD